MLQWPSVTLPDPAPSPRWLAWARPYRWREHGSADLAAGLTVAVMLVPQAMAYASLAGLSPVVGLYASVYPLLAYALIGSSRQLAVGPVAMDSLLVAAGVGALAAPGSDAHLRYAIALAAMVGVIHLALGLLRAERLVRLLTRPVIGGFTSGAAVLIALSQAKHFLGLDLGRSARLHEHLASILPRLDETHALTFALGAGALALLVGLKRWAPGVPRALVVVVLGTVATLAFGLDGQGVSVVGEVPAGLPFLALPTLTGAELVALAPTALAIAVVAIAEAFSVAEVFACREGYELAPRRELLGLGAANLVGSLFGGYPVTGGLSRTAVNGGAGARTQLAGVITALAVALSLLVLTPLFTHLPDAVLASIVMAAVAGLVDPAGFAELCRTDRPRAAVFAATALVVLFVGITEGIALGVAADWVRGRWDHSDRVAVDAQPLEPAPEGRPADAEGRRRPAHVPAVALERVDEPAPVG